MVLAAALTGPPRAMYKDDLEDERWMQIVEREVWLLLAKINEATKAWERTLRQNSKNWHRVIRIGGSEKEIATSFLFGWEMVAN